MNARKHGDALFPPGRCAPARAPSRIARSLRALAAAVLAPVAGQPAPQPGLETTVLAVQGHRVVAEVASTAAEQAVGLMGRPRLEPDHGMLFVTAERGAHCYWMRNTLIPLAVAFVDDDGTILGIAEMSPRTEVSHCAPRPVRYALEMEGGWFSARGIAPGARLGGLPRP